MPAIAKDTQNPTGGSLKGDETDISPLCIHFARIQYQEKPFKKALVQTNAPF